MAGPTSPALVKAQQRRKFTVEVNRGTPGVGSFPWTSIAGHSRPDWWVVSGAGAY